MKKIIFSLCLFSNLIFAEVMSNANVSLYKIDSNGTRQSVNIGTVQTNSSGSFQIPNVPVTQSGTGSDSDFYYEIEITKGTKSVSYPLANSQSATKDINVSKESTFAKEILSNVTEKNANNKFVPPSESVINALTTAVRKDVNNLSGKISLPSMDSNNSKISMAHGLTSLGGEIEIVQLASLFNSLYYGLNPSTSTTNDYAAYLTRVTKRACQKNKAGDANPMPYAVAQLLATKEKSSTTYTITQITSAFTSVLPVSVTAEQMASAYKNLLSSIDTKISTGSFGLTDVEKILALTKRGLNSSTITASTSLKADQAVALIYAMYDQNNSSGTGSCKMTSSFLTKIVSTFASSTLKDSAHISNFEIYNNSGFGCNGANQGHFVANVTAFHPSDSNATSVTITTTKTGDLNSTTSSTTLLPNVTSSGTTYQSNTTGVCVTLSQDINYTITANFSGSTTATQTVSRIHLTIPESSNTYNDANVSSNSASPTDTNGTTRPLFTWDDPTTVKSSITGAPTKSKIAYTYEFAHIDKTDSPVSPLSSCSKDETHVLHRTNSFIPSVDCDKSACATAASKTLSNIACRINIQTYLLDEYGNPLGQAAGNFTYFQP